MKKYSIKYIETYQRWYGVEANSPEEAEDILLRRLGEGKENAPDTCVSSGSFVEEI